VEVIKVHRHVIKFKKLQLSFLNLTSSLTQQIISIATAPTILSMTPFFYSPPQITTNSSSDRSQKRLGKTPPGRRSSERRRNSEIPVPTISLHKASSGRRPSILRENTYPLAGSSCNKDQHHGVGDGKGLLSALGEGEFPLAHMDYAMFKAWRRGSRLSVDILNVSGTAGGGKGGEGLVPVKPQPAKRPSRTSAVSPPPLPSCGDDGGGAAGVSQGQGMGSTVWEMVKRALKGCFRREVE